MGTRANARPSRSKCEASLDFCVLGNNALHNSSLYICQTFIKALFVFSTSSTITLVGAKKRKRNASSDHSDGEVSPASPVPLEDDLIMVQSHVYMREMHFEATTQVISGDNNVTFTLCCS